MSGPGDDSKPDARDDSGQALVLALIVLVLFAVCVVSILGLATTGFNGTQAVASQRATTYSADSALMGAIERVRNSSTLCSSSTWSTSGTATGAVFSYQTSGPNISVTCTWTATIESNLYATFTATTNSGALTLASANITFFNSLIPPWAYGTQPVEVASWTDAT